MEEFKYFSQVISYGRSAYQNIANNCNSFFNQTNKWLFSAPSAESAAICNASLNEFNDQISYLDQIINQGMRKVPHTGYNADSNNVAAYIGNVYAEAAINGVFNSANGKLPYTELATRFCPTQANSSECQQDMFALNRDAQTICRGYVTFGTQVFTSKAASIDGNLALYFLGAYAIGKALNSALEYWVGKHQSKNSDQEFSDTSIQCNNSSSCSF
jgi:hypothetical protein